MLVFICRCNTKKHLIPSDVYNYFFIRCFQKWKNHQKIENFEQNWAKINQILSKFEQKWAKNEKIKQNCKIMEIENGEIEVLLNWKLVGL